MSGWPDVPLREVLAHPLRTGISRAETPGAAHKVLTLGAARSDTLDITQARPMEASARELADCRIRPGSMYVVRGNGSRAFAGAAAKAPGTPPDDVVFPDLMIEVTPDPSVLLVEFLFVAWKSPSVRLQIEERLRTSAGIHKVNLRNLSSVRIPLPPLDEQRRIAAHLTFATGETRAALDEVEARRAHLGDLRESTITAAFRAAARAVDISLGSIGRLADGDWILTADYAPSGVRLLQVGDVGRGRLSIKSNRHITEKRATELKCTLLAPGDVLISRMPEPLGRACVLPDLGYPCITAVDVTIMRIDLTQADRDYLTGYLNSPEWYAAVAAKSSGATRPTISRRNLELLSVPLRSLAEQRRIAARLREQLAEIDRAKAALEAQRVAIDALPAALLREVFGEVSAA